MQSLNTLAVPSTARWFTEITDESDLLAALNFAAQHRHSVLVLGGGSNVVLSEHFPGLVIKMAITGIRVIAETDTDVYLTIGAGENWHQLVLWCVKKGYYGIENLALIPGTVGAAPIQNIGAYGVELADIFDHLDAIEIASGVKQRFNREECQFGYRDSIFKNQLKDQTVITQVGLRLSKQPCWNLSYPALAKAMEAYPATLTSVPTAQLIADTVIAVRQSKLPDPQKIPNVGSFFTNPLVTVKDYQNLRQRCPQIVSYPQAQTHYKLAAGWLLDNAGWGGKFIGGVGMHNRQALVLINPEKHSGTDIIAFAKLVQADIADRYGVQLEVEPRIYV